VSQTPPDPVTSVGRRSRSKRVILWSVVGLVAIWLVASAVLLAFGLLDASHGASEVQRAEARLSASDLVSQDPLGPLRAGREDFNSSSSLLGSPLLDPFEVLPVLGRQLRSVRDLSTAAATVSRIGVSAIGEMRSVLDMPHTAGPQRVATVERLARLASTTGSTSVPPRRCSRRSRAGVPISSTSWAGSARSWPTPPRSPTPWGPS
jgi:hypothetical protein